MSRLWLAGPLLLTIGGGVLYHFAAKSIPKTLNPSLVLVIVYATALAASLAAYVVLPASTNVGQARPWHPAVLGVGIGAFMIELGYVLAYRTGWPVSTTSVLTAGMVAVLLLPIGMGLFSERLSILNALGLALCLTGLVLLRQ
jgi:hypothetical protein